MKSMTLPTVLTMVFICTVVHAQEIRLPDPSIKGNLSVEAAISAKKSIRNFKGEPLSLAQASQMLWSAYGELPKDAIAGATIKTVPSAGGIYPLKVYLVVGKNTVGELAEGVYEYSPRGNSIKLITQGDVRNLLAYASHGQAWMAKAPAMIVIGSDFQSITARYQQRGIPYAYMEVGNANQNLYLQAESLKLGLGTVGAFDDAQVAAVLKLPNMVKPLAIMPFGK